MTDELSKLLELSPEDWEKVRPLMGAVVSCLDHVKTYLSNANSARAEDLLIGIENARKGLTAVGQAYSGDPDYIFPGDGEAGPKDGPDYTLKTVAAGLALGILNTGQTPQEFVASQKNSADKTVAALRIIYHGAMKADEGSGEE